MVSPALIRAPDTSSRRSQMPTQKPAMSNSSGSIIPGCSAVSPPRRTHPARRQPFGDALHELGDEPGSIRPHVMWSRKNAGRPPLVITSFALIATVSIPRPR